jgi:UDP-glucose 4-epimerase
VRVLITGGAGFIGSHLIEELVNANHEVIVVDNFSSGNQQKIAHIPNLHIHDLDIRKIQPKSFLEAPPDVVFHFAAYLGVENTVRNPINTLSAEVEGTINVLKEFTDFGVENFVFASSSEVYGESKVCKEDSNTCPKSSYSVAKLVNEHYFQAYSEEMGINCLVFRYFNAYGPRQDSRFVVTRFITCALNNEPLYVHDDGSQTRSFTYVKDSARLSFLLFEKTRDFELYNIGNPDSIQIIDLAKKIKMLTDSYSEIKFKSFDADGRSLDTEIYHRKPDCEKAISRTGSFKWKSLDEGLQYTIDYIKNQAK